MSPETAGDRTDAPQAPAPGSESPPPPGRGRRLSGVLLALAWVAMGFGLGFLVFGSPEPAPEVAPPTETTVPTAPSPEALAVEPVVAVAEAVLPSVVQIEARAGMGSGVIYDSEGLILTAAHVVAGEELVGVRLSDGTEYQGEVLGGDRSIDVAVVRIEADGLPAADLAVEGDLQVGQLAVAIGSPFGLDSTVTAGVVSAVNQTIGRGGNFQSLIQTDAAINPGNSGGALANRDGQVIGINVSIFSTSGGNIGVGFAVPIDVAHDLAQAVVNGEPLERAVLGVTGTTTESGPRGALVTGVVPGSGAEVAGIEVGDVIIAIDGVRVESIGDLIAQVRRHRPGDTVTLDVVRPGTETQLEVELGSQ